jgi:hypothetical protein
MLLTVELGNIREEELEKQAHGSVSCNWQLNKIRIYRYFENKSEMRT